MNSLLRGLRWTTCLRYLNDVIIFSPTFDQHLSHLAVVLEIFRVAGLQLNSKKVRIGEHPNSDPRSRSQPSWQIAWSRKPSRSLPVSGSNQSKVFAFFTRDVILLPTLHSWIRWNISPFAPPPQKGCSFLLFLNSRTCLLYFQDCF